MPRVDKQFIALALCVLQFQVVSRAGARFARRRSWAASGAAGGEPEGVRPVLQAKRCFHGFVGIGAEQEVVAEGADQACQPGVDDGVAVAPVLCEHEAEIPIRPSSAEPAEGKACGGPFKSRWSPITK